MRHEEEDDEAVMRFWLTRDVSQVLLKQRSHPCPICTTVNNLHTCMLGIIGVAGAPAPTRPRRSRSRVELVGVGGFTNVVVQF
jgi:hypothetical protein